jgi:hypothetical protein
MATPFFYVVRSWNKKGVELPVFLSSDLKAVEAYKAECPRLRHEVKTLPGTVRAYLGYA